MYVKGYRHWHMRSMQGEKTNGRVLRYKSKVLFLWARGRPVEADQGGCHSDLWAS